MLLAGFSASAKDFNVVDFGANAADPAFDNTAAFQNALNAAKEAGGGIVSVPSGQYRFNGTFEIPTSVTLQGTFRVAPSDERRPKTPDLYGSVLMAYAGRGDAAGAPFIRLAGGMATLAGFIINYPEWKQADVPPVPYPPTVQSGNTVNVGVLDCCFLGAYEAIHFDGAARFLVRNACGYPSYRGLFVDNCYDIGRVENCHFWPFGVTYKPDDPYCLWVNTNAVAFEFARTDWQYVYNTFCFGYGVGYKFSRYKNGGCNGNFLGIGADCCRRAVLVENMQPFGILITNGEFVGRWSSQDSVTIEVAEQADLGKLSLMNCAFWGPNDRCIWNHSDMAMISAIGCNFFEWDINGLGSPAIQMDAGKAIIQGNTFWQGELNVQLGEEVESAIISGNQAPLGLAVDNQAGARAQIFGNELDPRVWPKGWQRHYRVDVGRRGDKNFLHKFHKPEKAGEWPDKSGMKRWTTGDSSLRLPVLPRKAYTISIDAFMPAGAIDPQNGIFIGDKKVADLPDKEGPATITVNIPPQKADTVEIRLHTKTWKPANGGVFDRTLGMAVRSVTIKAKGAKEEAFDANTGGEAGSERAQKGK
jgi:hypothetical protein